MKSRCYFVTGTDTDAGKTTVSLAWMMALKNLGYHVIGLKPLATGGIQTADGLRSPDALLLQAASSEALPYHQINPFCFEQPTAFHIAAAQEHQKITIAQLQHCLAPLLTSHHETPDKKIIMEGIGGWFTPLNDTETYADFLKTIEVAVILVVHIKLGSFNHALLTAEAIQRQGFTLAGWVANCATADFISQTEYIASLKQWIQAPLLSVMPFTRLTRPSSFPSEFAQ